MGRARSGYLQSSREYLELYQELFGPYPYEKFAIVENFYPTGYGFPGWTLLGSSVIRLPFIRTTSLPHEIAHTWWGNAVEIDYSSGNWGEGLATYVADYYLKELHAPAEALEYRRRQLGGMAAPLFDGVALEESLVQITADKAHRLLFKGLRLRNAGIGLFLGRYPSVDNRIVVLAKFVFRWGK